jgi:hypothetical protein
VVDRTTKAREEDTITEGIRTGVIITTGEKEGIRRITIGIAVQVVNSKGKALISNERLFLKISLTSRGIEEEYHRVLAHSHNKDVTNNHSSKEDHNNQINSQTCNNNNR